MKLALSLVLFSLVSASAMFGQMTPVPAILTALPGVPNTPVQQCGPTVTVDVVMIGAVGSLVRTCEAGFPRKVSGNILASGFPGGFVDSAVGTADGATMIMMSDGKIVRVRDRASQWYPLGRASAFLQGDYNQVTLLREDGTTWQYWLSWEGSFTARPIQSEPLYLHRCTKVFQNSPIGDLFCVDRNNGVIRRANASLMRPARMDEAEKYFAMPGLVDAAPYKDGIIALVQAQYDCGEPVQIPESATLCYPRDACRRKTLSQLVHLTGRDSAQMRVIARDLDIVYSSTLKVVGEEVLVVESRYEGNEWLGDEVARYDIRTGQRSVYWSRDTIRNQYGLGPQELWLVQ